MSKLGFDANEKFSKRLAVCGVVKLLEHAFMIILTTICINNLKVSTRFKIDMTFSYVIENTYMALFFDGFCIFLYTIYVRFEIINECIRYDMFYKG